MALSDVHFSEGDKQDFILEIPTAVYAGSINDMVVESGGSSGLLSEIPQVIGGGDNIFIISE